jgi:hypothetical protein
VEETFNRSTPEGVRATRLPVAPSISTSREFSYSGIDGNGTTHSRRVLTLALDGQQTGLMMLVASAATVALTGCMSGGRIRDRRTCTDTRIP